MSDRRGLVAVPDQVKRDSIGMPVDNSLPDIVGAPPLVLPSARVLGANSFEVDASIVGELEFDGVCGLQAGFWLLLDSELVVKDVGVSAAEATRGRVARTRSTLHRLCRAYRCGR